MIEGLKADLEAKPKWTAVGMVLMERQVNAAALERCMLRAWGLRSPASFRHLDNNRFVVQMQSEGDWKHVMENGPWQFEYHAVVMKEIMGNIRPSEVMFTSLPLWVQFLDLPTGMMKKKYGYILGGWLGKVQGVDADEEGKVWGDVLRVRVEIPIDQPLVRAVWVKESVDDDKGVWYDVRYEKIPHFCLSCGKLFHGNGTCEGANSTNKEWGGWLRASPRKTRSNNSASSKQNMFSSSLGSKSISSETKGNAVIRDLPTNRAPFTTMILANTEGRKKTEVEVTSPLKIGCAEVGEVGQDTEKSKIFSTAEKDGQGAEVPGAARVIKKKYVKKPTAPKGKNDGNVAKNKSEQISRKRNMSNIWVPVDHGPIVSVEEGIEMMEGVEMMEGDGAKRQKTEETTLTVFNSVPAAEPAEE